MAVNCLNPGECFGEMELFDDDHDVFLKTCNFKIYSSRSPFGGLMIKKLFFISTNGTIS